MHNSSNTMRIAGRAIVFCLLSTAVVSCGGQEPAAGSGDRALNAALRSTESRKSRAPTVTPQNSGHPDKRIFGISPVNERVVWATATTPAGGGTWLKTTDGGANWASGVVPGAEGLQFRDVEGVSERVAYLLAAGGGTNSRLYRTEDGGKTWTLTYTNPDANGFYDCFAFWSSQRGILMADSVEGKFPALRTRDGARSWEDLRNRMPPAQPGEGGFAASGTCAATQGEKRGWMVTGASGAPNAHARVLATRDGGNTWAAYETPFPSTATDTSVGGLFTIAFRDAQHGITAGGDLANAVDTAPNVARSSDGGVSWAFTARRTNFLGAAYGLAYASGKGEHEGEDDGDDEAFARTVVITGPNGTDWSSDEGDTWTPLPIDGPGYWAVAFASPKAGWLVGNRGRILKISF